MNINKLKKEAIKEWNENHGTNFEDCIDAYIAVGENKALEMAHFIANYVRNAQIRDFRKHTK